MTMKSKKTSNKFKNILNRAKYSKEDCLATTKTINNLWSWANNLEWFGIGCAFFLFLEGIFESIQLANVVETVGTYYTHTKTVFDFGIFITSLLRWALYSFIGYCSFHSVALLIGTLGDISYQTRVTTKATLTACRFSDAENAPFNENPARAPKPMQQQTAAGIKEEVAAAQSVGQAE